PAPWLTAAFCIQLSPIGRQTIGISVLMTMPNFERVMPTGMAPKGTRFWRAAELSLTVPWYAVTLEAPDGEGTVIRNFLVTDDRDVVSLAEQSTTGSLLALK